MSLIDLAKKAADDAEKKQQREVLYEASLQDRLERLRQLVLAEVRPMDLEICKYGKLIVTIEDGDVMFAGYGRCFGYVSIPGSDENPRVLELTSKIDIGMMKYSSATFDEGELQEYRNPTVYAKVYCLNGQFQTYSCTDSEESTTRFFNDVGKQLSAWF